MSSSYGAGVLPPSLREVAERKRGRRECRTEIRTLPQSPSATHSFVVRLPLAIVNLERFATLKEGAKGSIQLLVKLKFDKLFIQYSTVGAAFPPEFWDMMYLMPLSRRARPAL